MNKKLLVILLSALTTLVAACFGEKAPDSFDRAAPVVHDELGVDRAGSDAGLVSGKVVQGVGDLDYEEKVVAQEQIIKQQEREMRQQQKDLDHLKRQEYYNEALKKYQKQ